MYSREREELIERGLSFTVRMLHSENLEGATAVDMVSETDSVLARIFDPLEVRLLGRRGLMNKFAIKGDWKSAEILLRHCSSLASDVITDNGGTALHVAATVNNTKFVRELVKRMSDHDSVTKDSSGCTAFFYAVASGKVEVVDILKERNPNLIAAGDSMNPLKLAALLGNKDMFSFLYKLTRSQDLSTNEWFQIVIATSATHIYDEAIDILKDNKCVDVRFNRDRMKALHHLARVHIADNISASKEAIFKSLFTLFADILRLSWLKRKFEQPLMPKKALLLAEKLWEEIQASGEADVDKLFAEAPLLHDAAKVGYATEEADEDKPPLLHAAAKVGNAGFIRIFTRTNPNLIFNKDKNQYNLFHVAVLERQENVFRLIYQTHRFTKLMMAPRDKHGNNILHLAGILAPPDRLKIVSGAAFQMQRELMWLKTVEKIVLPSCLEMKNNAGYTPRLLFSKQHGALFKEAGTWMKDTANYCMVVATLISTVAFAAAITVPGGNNGDSGIPILLNSSWFTVFVVSDFVAMFFATASIIVFLSLLISRYQEDDFLVSLPTKLMFGFATLFFSIVGTLFAFTSTFFLLFNEEWLRVPEWIVVSACVSLIALFCILNYRLCIDTFRSAYLSRFLCAQSKYSLY